MRRLDIGTGTLGRPAEQKKGSVLPMLVIFGGVGVILLSITFYLHSARQAFIGSSLSAEGLVVGFEERAGSRTSSGKSLNAYAPIVTFTSKSGAEVTFTEATAGSGSGIKKGDTVEVFYDEENPQDAKIATFFYLWAAPIVIGAIGSAFSLVGVILLIVFIRER
ncbi:MAG: DUF3592 domain-containing protein [Acidobacteriota bacterium]|nr:MAG: DUF3592 domain-containing protein [Acidobacteriota bacterium]